MVLSRLTEPWLWGDLIVSKSLSIKVAVSTKCNVVRSGNGDITCGHVKEATETIQCFSVVSCPRNQRQYVNDHAKPARSNAGGLSLCGFSCTCGIMVHTKEIASLAADLHRMEAEFSLKSWRPLRGADQWGDGRPH